MTALWCSRVSVQSLPHGWSIFSGNHGSVFLPGSVAALPAAESSFRLYYAFHICFQREMRKNLRRMIVRLAQGCECGAVTEDEQSIAVEYVGSSWQQVVNCAGVLLQGVFLRLLPAQCGVGVADEAANIMGDRLQPRCYRTA